MTRYSTQPSTRSSLSFRASGLIASVLLVSFGTAACGGSYPAPTEKMANTTAAVRAAEEVGGNKEPQAALHLKLAEEQLEQAKKLMAEEDNKRADYILMRADADAELAVALAREASAKAEAQKARDDLAALKKEAAAQ